MRRRARWSIISVLLLSTSAALARPPFVASHGIIQNSTEEFVGPFASWMCARSSGSGTCGTAAAAFFNAVADGITDDSTALQNGLNHLGFGSSCSAGSGCNPVIYFPPGNYNIHTQLVMPGQTNVALVCADPATTTITWGGGSSTNAMMWLQHAILNKITRCTFNGSSGIQTLIRQASSTQGDSSNEYSDLVLKNATSMAYSCGDLGSECSESSMLRDYFISNDCGIALWNSNALDVWTWYSSFTGNGYGVTNGCRASGHGTFSVFNSNFQGSTTADAAIGNTGQFSLRRNYSNGSNQFWSANVSGNPAQITFQGNTVLNTTQTASINNVNEGPIILIDNAISGLSGPVVIGNGPSSSGDMLSMGNTFQLVFASAVSNNGRTHETGDVVGTPAGNAPTLPGAPPNRGRTIYETSPSGSGTTCSSGTPCSVQTAICLAATGSSGFSSGCTGTVAPSQSVVHVPSGAYSISTTLSVPATADIQIIGDGGNSSLNWTGASSGLVLQINGPSRAVVRDLAINGNSGNATDIEINSADFVGSTVYAQQLISTTQPGTATGVFVDALDLAIVELDNSQINSAQTGLKVTGGPFAAGGNWLGGQTMALAGATFGLTTMVSSTNGAHTIVEDYFYDLAGGASMVGPAISGLGAFTISNAALNAANNPLSTVTGFTGISNFSNLLTTAGVGLSGTGSGANNLGLGIWCNTASSVCNAPTWVDTTSPADTNGFLLGTSINGGCGLGACPLSETGASSSGFLTTTMAQMRSAAPLALNVPGVKMYRVILSGGSTNLHIKN